MFFNISAEDKFTKSIKKYLKRLIIYYTLNGVFFHDLELADPEVDQNVVGSDFGETISNIIAESYKMADKYDMPILYSCHPRFHNRLAASGFVLDKRVIQHEPLGFHDYNCLQMNAFAVVSDSGTLPEKSSFFTSVGHPFPAVCIRTSTECPEALDKGCFVLAGIDEKKPAAGCRHSSADEP